MKFADLPDKMDIWEDVDERGGMVRTYTRDGGVLVAMPNTLEDELAIIANMRKHGFIVKAHPQAIGYARIEAEEIPATMCHMAPDATGDFYLMYHFVAEG